MTLNKERLHDAFDMYAHAVRRDSMKAVTEGGGMWVGLQETEGMPYKLVLFNSPTTGSTLCLKTSEITAALVRTHIATSDRKFKQEKTK